MTMDTIVKDLKALPPDRLERAADYIHRLRIVRKTERNALLRGMAGIWEGSLGDDFARDVEAGCEHVDERDW